ncbi:ATP synthase regulation protein NCA2-domain-containing protein [Mycotypha africana]|uniref:ATP synthase regulation protein NCA2-domain-containing protein n=1 Tax=Mycotypha africana TaxID=64632 RepID=UPI002300D74D|nr:ATP synthase regulation protein NCA2-domain-containing protein [Mycotypha africana]KAI8967342.1 ATP synthase regulation protein NCA2-domain-containing protein [Mycotypha africana]
MSTFVDEQVKRLDTILSRSFEQSLDFSSLSFQALNEGNQFLIQTIQALDFQNASNIPSLKKLQEYLQKYLNDINSTATTNAELEWFFVAKCTIAVYGHVFSKLLELTLPVSESINYWNSIQGNTMQEIYYAMQIAPSRLYHLLKNTVKNLSTKSVNFHQLSSMDFIITQLFPVHNEQHQKQRSRKTAIDLLKFFNLSSLRHRPFLLQIIRNEIELKKTTLQRIRSELAASLGVMLLTPPQFTDGIPKETKQCVEMIHYIMRADRTASYNSYGRRNSQKNDKHFQEQFSLQESNTTSAKDIASELNQILQTWSLSCESHFTTVQSLYGIPSTLSRYWIPALLLYYAGDYAIRYGLDRQDDILHYTREFGKTAYEFLLNWVWEPMVKVYNTIRLKDQRLSLLSKEGLQSDLDSLERMVVGFATDNLHLAENELSHLALDVREGDLSVLLKEYEREIKNPLKNVITGNLLQTMLIQVQKVKVDVDLAMSALDKLLKSNELNFAFLAVAPSMLLTYASASWLKNRLRGRSQQKTNQTN